MTDTAPTIAEVERQLARRASPRLHMSLIVAASGLSALLASFLLLRGGTRWWLAPAFRRTIVPAAFMAALLGLAGLGLERWYPGATSIGRVLERVGR